MAEEQESTLDPTPPDPEVMEKVKDFLCIHPYTVNTCRQIALRIDQVNDEVQKCLDILKDDPESGVQKIRYPGADVFRYIPPRRKG